MTQYKHVLVLIILILPMFVLAPTLVASPNEVLSNRAPVDTSLPAQFVEETLRVAVYAEDNTSLPSYATGGVYTDHYANVISLLESEGYAVDALSTQDILDHKLMVADYDVFVLPNQLPRETITNLVKDYWLGGGGILSFDGSIGFAFYAGLIDESLEGNFELTPPATPGYWGVDDIIYSVTVNQRHPITQAYEVDDSFVMPSGNYTIVNGIDLPGIIGDELISLVTWNVTSLIPLVAAFDNPDRGGKIVQIPGNGEVIPAWLNPIIFDAVDWLAPKPKGRILFDLSHLPEVTPDTWDPWVEAHPLTMWRDGLVNHSYIVDKLYPSSEGNLTSDNLEGYDMLVICMPNLNFTAQEITDVMNWVSAGGGLITVSDDPTGFAHVSRRLNDLLVWSDIRYNATLVGPFDTVLSQVGEHPTHESTSSIVVGGFSYPHTVGPNAYPIWEHSGSGLAIIGDDYGQGRVIAYPDGNFMTDDLGITELDNYQFHLNIANWLSAAKAEVLLHVYNLGLTSPYDSPAYDALNDLGIPFYFTHSVDYMNLSLSSQQWSLVIIDQAWPGLNTYLGEISSYLDTGGDLIMSWYRVDTFEDNPLYSKIGFEFAGDPLDKAPFHIWDSGHGIFNYPNNYESSNFTSMEDYGDEGDMLTVFPNATALAGFSDTDQPGNASTVLGFNGHALYNAYLIDQLSGDLDDSTYSDALELWENQIAFMYYDRPTIDHPSDVTYMETETGNTITWTPMADAGAGEYSLRINGSTHGMVDWDGSAISINVDGVNASISTYELTVYDKLGYSVSDQVTLNVTEYVAPPGPGFDPMLLLVIGAVGVVVVVILVIFMKKKKG